MRLNHRHPPGVITLALLLTCLLAWPAAGFAQGSSPGNVTGQASVLQATLFGFLLPPTSYILVQTGTLTGSTDARDASSLTGNIPSIITSEVPSATTIGYPNQVDSAASLQNMTLTIAGITISADSILAQASMVSGAAGTGSSSIGNLQINGVPIAVTGSPNQTISVLGGRVIINEQTVSSTGAFVVNALHISVPGVVDAVVASATAGA